MILELYIVYAMVICMLMVVSMDPAPLLTLLVHQIDEVSSLTRRFYLDNNQHDQTSDLELRIHN